MEGWGVLRVEGQEEEESPAEMEWLVLRGLKIYVYRRREDLEYRLSVCTKDCAARNTHPRMISLETPAGVVYTLELQTIDEKTRWLKTLQSLNTLMETGGKEFSLEEIVMGDDMNRLCADCGAPYPSWCSISFGVFICVSCASVHRALGADLSRVKSLAMDNLEQSDLKVLADIGNRRGNELPSRQRRICRMVPIEPSTSWEDRVFWILHKYAPDEVLQERLDSILQHGKLVKTESMARMKALRFDEMVNLRFLECHGLCEQQQEQQGGEPAHREEEAPLEQEKEQGLCYRLVVWNQEREHVYTSPWFRPSGKGSVRWKAGDGAMGSEEVRVGIHGASRPLLLGLEARISGSEEEVEEEEGEEEEVEVVGAEDVMVFLSAKEKKKEEKGGKSSGARVPAMLWTGVVQVQAIHPNSEMPLVVQLKRRNSPVEGASASTSSPAALSSLGLEDPTPALAGPSPLVFVSVRRRTL